MRKVSKCVFSIYLSISRGISDVSFFISLLNVLIRLHSYYIRSTQSSCYSISISSHRKLRVYIPQQCHRKYPDLIPDTIIYLYLFPFFIGKNILIFNFFLIPLCFLEVTLCVRNPVFSMKRKEYLSTST